MNIQIRNRGVDLSAEWMEYAERRLRFALSRFEGRIGSIVITVSDTNGPKGGDDKECKIAVRAAGGNRVVISERGSDLFVAVAHAAERVGQAVARNTAVRRNTLKWSRDVGISMGD